jgi:hypothetical protein
MVCHPELLQDSLEGKEVEVWKKQDELEMDGYTEW